LFFELEQHVRSAYQPPASSIFLSQQTSHQQSDNNTFLSEQISTSHQPPAKRTLEGSSTRFAALPCRFCFRRLMPHGVPLMYGTV
jgi:hypothetical protein